MSMKYDITKPPTRGARRVLGAFTEAFFALVCEKSFESLSVSEICDRSGYPRATFYNYFDDKYDLLNYYWSTVAGQIDFDSFVKYSKDEVFDIYVNRIYDLMEQHESKISALLVNNPNGGYFLSSCQLYLSKSIEKMLKIILGDKVLPVSATLLADYYANTLLLVFGHRFSSKSGIRTKSDTMDSLYYLMFERADNPL